MKPKYPKALHAVTLCLSLAIHAHAASDSWKANVSGNWNDSANWTGGEIPGSTATNNSADIATFGFTLATSGKTVTVDANRNIGGISFTNTSAFGYTLSGGNLKLSNGGVIQLTGNTGAHTETIDSAIEIQGDGGTATFTSSSTLATRLLKIGDVSGVSTGSNVTTLTLNGTQSPSGVLENAVSGIVSNGSGGGKLAIVKDGAGAWTLSNTGNTFSGGVEVKAGLLRATSAGALGSGAVTLGGGQLHLINNTNTNFGNNVTVTGDAIITPTRVSGSAGTITQTMGTLSIGANTLGITKFSATTTSTLVFGNTTLTGNATFAPAAGTIVQLGAISGGASGLTQNGAGTTVLAGANTFGSTTVTAGTLQVGSGGATGDLGSGAVSVASGSFLSFSRNNAATFANAITGAGIVRNLGASSIVDLTNDSHTGSTQILNGVLGTNNTVTNIVLGTTGAATTYGVLGLKADFTGSLGTGAGGISWATGVSSSGGFAVMDAATRAVNIGGNVTPDTLTLNTGGFVGGTLASSNSRIKFGDINGLAQGTVDFRNSINLGSGDRSLIFVVDGAAQYAAKISGNITGSGVTSGTGDAVVKFGNANMILTGNNTYTGRTVVGGQGSIILGSAGAASPNTWFALDAGSGGTLGGILGLGHGDLNANLGQSAGNVHFNNSGGFAAFGADRSVTLNSGVALTWASTTSFVANGQNLILGQAKADAKVTVTNDINLNGAARTVHVNNGSSAVDAELAGSLTGTGGGLVKGGAGTLVLSGTSTYTGATTVSAGTLLVNGSLGATTVAVSAGATLGGNGMIEGALNVSGRLSAGNSIESLATGTVSLNNGSTLVHEMNPADAGLADLVASSGQLNLTGTVTLDLTGADSPLWALNDKVTLVSYFDIDGSTPGWNGGLFNGYADDSQYTFGSNTWLFNYDDTSGGTNFTGDQASGANARFVTMTLVPEPSMALLGLIGLVPLLRRRR